MSVVSFIRTAGVTWLPTNNPSSIANTSLVLALISMMSTRPCRTISRMLSRNSLIDLNGPVAGLPPGARPGEASPNAMSASLASARIKSWQAGLATMRASFKSSDFSGCDAGMEMAPGMAITSDHSTRPMGDGVPPP